MQDFYVYEHWRSDTGLPFYVGKGRGNRASNLFVRGKHYRQLVSKLKRLGFEIEIRKIFTGLSEELAFTLEKATISYWKARNIPLINKTAGGGGTSGYRWTRQQKLQSSCVAKLRWKKPTYRSKVEAAVKQAMRRPDVLAKSAAWHQDPRKRAKHRESLKASWRDPEVRAERLAVYTAEHRGRLSEATKAGMASTGCRAKISAGVAALWRDPIYREKQVAALRAASEKSRGKPKSSYVWKLSEEERREVNKRRADKLREAYKDPALRLKIGAAVKIARASSEERTRMRVAAKASWARRKQEKDLSMTHPNKADSVKGNNAKLRKYTEDYGAADPKMNKLASVDRFKKNGPEEAVGYGAEDGKATPRGDRPARKSSAANPIATYAKGGRVRQRADGGRLEGEMGTPGGMLGSRGSRSKGKSASTNVNIIVAPQAPAQPQPAPPPLEGLAGEGGPPPSPPLGMGPVGPSAGAGAPPGGPGGPGPLAGMGGPGGRPLGATPPGLPQIPRKRGGRVHPFSKKEHPDEVEDKALVKDMVKPSALKRAAGGRMTAGAESGPGRLEKTANRARRQGGDKSVCV